MTPPAAPPSPSLSQPHKDLLRASLVAVWLATAAVSAWELRGQSTQLLQGLHLPTPWVHAVVWAGAGADVALGVWMWWWPSRWAYVAALALMGAMTIAASVIEPTLWLHPLGPLTKNLPIAAILWVLLRTQSPAPARPTPPAKSLFKEGAP